MPGPSDCQQCGMFIPAAGEYHPFAMCQLVKARGGSTRTGATDAARLEVASILRDGRSEDPNTRRRIDEFLARVPRP